MPTYRYRCDACGEEIEVWQSIHDDPLTTHDADGGTLRKVLQPVGVVLKGSGFYRNDSRSGSTSNGSGSSSSTSTKDKESKDSKPAKDTTSSSSDSSTSDSSKSGSTGTPASSPKSD
jgi:putative FmdB family regulatory protein